MFNLPNGATTNCLQDLKRKKRHHELQSNQQPHQNLKVKKIKTESSYEKIRTQLHLSSTTKTELLGRTSELAQVTSFFEKHLKSQQPGSLFISGPPGTGKTHLIFHFSDKLRKQSPHTKTLYINCMKLSSSSEIYLEMANEWNISTEKLSVLRKNNDSFIEISADLEKTLIPEHKNSKVSMFVLILDEMDQLQSNVFYQLFSWTTRTNSLLLLIGIANTVDMTERLLPRLRSQKIHIESLHFKPYTTEQIIAIIKQRLSSVEERIFEENAITLLAKKIASSSGDIRKALDVCEVALSLAEKESKKQNALVKVNISYMAKALDQAFVSPIVEQVKKLPHHQKIILCALYQLKSNSRISISQVRNAYLNLCKSIGFDGLPISEFNEIIQTLPGCGMISIEKKGKEPRVSLLIPESDLAYALRDDPLPLKDIFSEASS